MTELADFSIIIVVVVAAICYFSFDVTLFDVSIEKNAFSNDY